jgi:hypothetical protein
MTAHHSSSESFVFLKHAHLASIPHPPQPQLASLTERPHSLFSEHHQDAGAKGGHARGRGVGQEKVSLTGDRQSTTQPAAGTEVARTPDADTNAARSQSLTSVKRSKVPFTLHVDPLVKADVAEQARLDNISASQEGADLMREMLHQKLHTRKAATLGSVIEAIIDRKFSQRDNRLAYLLLSNLLATEETRYIQANMFSRLPGVTPQLYDAFMDKAAEEARRKLGRRKPHLTHLKAMLHELADILAATEDEEQGEQQKPPAT